jgi:hypothetical protein
MEFNRNALIDVKILMWTFLRLGGGGGLVIKGATPIPVSRIPLKIQKVGSSEKSTIQPNSSCLISRAKIAPRHTVTAKSVAYLLRGGTVIQRHRTLALTPSSKMPIFD